MNVPAGARVSVVVDALQSLQQLAEADLCQVLQSCMHANSLPVAIAMLLQVPACLWWWLRNRWKCWQQQRTASLILIASDINVISACRVIVLITVCGCRCPRVSGGGRPATTGAAGSDSAAVGRQH